MPLGTEESRSSADRGSRRHMRNPPHKAQKVNACRNHSRQAETVRMADEAPSSDADHVRRVKPLVAALDLELDELSLGEGLETLHRDGGEVNEDVLPSLLLNEAIALGIIEPLDLPSGH